MEGVPHSDGKVCQICAVRVESTKVGRLDSDSESFEGLAILQGSLCKREGWGRKGSLISQKEDSQVRQHSKNN